MKIEDNVTFVKRLMEFNPAGALAQAFVIEALASYSQSVMKSEPWGDEVMISFPAWHACARHILKEIEARNA